MCVHKKLHMYTNIHHLKASNHIIYIYDYYYKKRHTTGVISNRPNLTISHHLAFALLSNYKPLAKFIVKRTFFVECHWHAVVTKKDCSPLNSSENVTRVVIKYTVTLQQQQP